MSSREMLREKSPGSVTSLFCSVCHDAAQLVPAASLAAVFLYKEIHWKERA
jgi:hypothetical protein